MTSDEWLGLGISYAYAGGLLLVGEVLRRALGVSPDLTRKLIHIGAGMWVFGVLALFDRWQVGIIPFATFIVVNYVLYRTRLLGAMDTADSTPGTVYFAIAMVALFGLLWRPAGPIDRAPVAAAAAMALTWGDALAALVGRRLGRRRYRVGQSTRSLEGSAVMLAASAAAMLPTLLLLPGSALAPLAAVAWERALAGALLAAVAATLAEAVSPHGTDNLTVPAAAALALLAVGL